MKNNMRTPKEKEKIIQKYFNGYTVVNLSKEYGIGRKLIYSWIHKYEKNGIDGLKSKTGKKVGKYKGFGPKKPKNRIEELELELLKKDIEIARLKKGYMVKGVGQKKEFVTTFEKNIK